MECLQHELTCLLCFQDGVINDVDKTVELLVEASSLPLSVIILGVGPTDFSLMVCLLVCVCVRVCVCVCERERERERAPDVFHNCVCPIMYVF